MDSLQNIHPRKQDLEAIISEKIRFEISRPHSSHVIKERDHDKTKTKSKVDFKKKSPPKSHLTPPAIRGRNNVQPTKNINQTQKKKGVGDDDNKRGKWPEVESCYLGRKGHQQNGNHQGNPHQQNGHTDTGSSDLINQLNNLRKAESDQSSQDIEVGFYFVTNENLSVFLQFLYVKGPFDFKALLRKSKVLPTDTLRERRHTSRPHVSQACRSVYQESFQDMSSTVNL